jgi:ATP-dependent protease HslVU (ClpYQ) peptidase subunit
MTCIIAWFDNKEKKVIMAGDKTGSNGWDRDLVKEPKVFKKKDFMLGYTSSFRMGQLLKHVWTPPKRTTDETDDHYLYVTVVNSFKELFKENGYGKDEKNAETGVFLFVYKDRIFEHQADCSILERETNVQSVGCGEVFARGCMNALLEYETDYKVIAKKAFKLIAHYNPHVSEVHDIITSKDTKKP